MTETTISTTNVVIDLQSISIEIDHDVDKSISIELQFNSTESQSINKIQSNLTTRTINN